MTLSAIASRINSRQQETEFALLLTWALLYPRKGDLLYVAIQALLLTVFTLARLLRAPSLAVTPFSGGLAAANLLLLAGCFFSASPGRSLLAVADFGLASLYLATWDLERHRLPNVLNILLAILSAASLVNLAAAALHPGQRQVSVLFGNPILQGVASGLAVILLLAKLLARLRPATLLLLLLNLAAMLAAGSKAALLGTLLLAAYLLVAQRPRWLPLLAALAALALFIPNPTQRMARDWLHRDPYALNRIDIWKMSLRILQANLWTGIGPEMFYEHARLHNFPQSQGPTRYGKIPESPHNDYLKVACETGLPGVLALLGFLLLLGRKLLAAPRQQPEKLALLFLLLQAALFDFLFLPFFTLTLLFLLKPQFDEPPAYLSLPAAAKAGWAFILVFGLCGLYLMPLAADRLLRRADGSANIVERFALLDRADRLDFLGLRAPLAKARLLGEFSKRRHDLDAWGSAMANAQRLRRRNRMAAESWLQQAYLLVDLLADRGTYPGVEEEIVGLLRQALAVDPNNPFTRLRIALVRLQFNHPLEARQEALEAIRLEPDFVAALRLLHDRFGFFPEPQAYGARLQAIAAKARRLGARPGTYPFELFRDDSPGR